MHTMGSFVTYTRAMNFDQDCLFVPDGDPQLQYVTRARGHHDASNGAVPCYTRARHVESRHAPTLCPVQIGFWIGLR
jgi:hypothetical protein